MNEEHNYPDLIVGEPPDGFKKLERINGAKANAPKISWGHVYKDWPLRKRLKYAEDLASSMNYAADLLQQERNKALVIIQGQEKQLQAAQEGQGRQMELLNRQLSKYNESRQSLLQRIVSLEETVGQQARALRGLKDGHHD